MARKYTRDNRGRFASVGATARGGRLKTASGGKRKTQTMSAKSPGLRSGTIAKGGRGVSGSVARSLAAVKKGRQAPAAGAAAPAAKPRLKRTGKVIKKARSLPPATTTNYRQALPPTSANRPRIDRAAAIMQRSISGKIGFQEIKKLRSRAAVAANPYSGMSKAERTKAANNLSKAELQNKKADKSYSVGAKADSIYRNLVGYTSGEGRKKWRRSGQRSTSLGPGTIRGGASRSVRPSNPSQVKAAPSRSRTRLWYESRARR